MARTGMRTIGWASLILTTCFFTLGGCNDSDLQQARQEAMTAKAEVRKLQLRLAHAESQINDMKAENRTVRETRDVFNDRVQQLAREKEKVSALAAQAQQTIASLSVKADNEADTTVSLKEQVAQLKALVAEQQTRIQQQQAVIEWVQQYLPQDTSAGQTAATTTTGTATTSDTNSPGAGSEQ